MEYMLPVTIVFTILLCAITWLFVFLTIYFVPVIVAYVRKHKNIVAITILTIFLGWSFLGWLGALLWSLNSDVETSE